MTENKNGDENKKVENDYNKIDEKAVMADCAQDITFILNNFQIMVNCYRLLIGGANELNNITIAHKRDVSNALKRVRESGEIIDDMLEYLEKINLTHLDYCGKKAQFIKKYVNSIDILNEVEEELKFKAEKKAKKLFPKLEDLQNE